MVRTIVNGYNLYFSKVHFWPTAVIVIIECLSCSGHLNKHFIYTILLSLRAEVFSISQTKLTLILRDVIG